MKWQRTGGALALFLLACAARELESANASRSSDPVREMQSDGGPGGMGDVVGFAVRRDSTVVVGDAANAQIVHIAADGAVIARSGRRGSLAGEYQRLQWVGMCDDNEVMVHDIALSRVSTLSETLQPLRARTIPKWYDSRDVAGCLSSARVLILNDSLPYRVQGVVRRPLSLVAFDLGSGAAETLKKFAGTQFNYVRRLGTAIAVPLGQRTHVAVAGGVVVVAESDGDSLWRYERNAWSAVGLRGLPGAQPVTAVDDKRARLALGWAPRTAPERAFVPELLAETQSARIAPRIDALVASDDGTAWVALKPNARGQREWIGYGPDGEQRGTTQFTWTFEPRVVRGPVWWGVERDSIGVEMVVRYRVR